MTSSDDRPETSADTAGRPPDEAPGDGQGIRVVDRRWWARPGGADGPDTPDAGSDKPMYVQELEQRLAAKDDELRATIARYREASAEFEDMRARMRRDVAKEIERGRRHVLVDILDVVDNLDRAIDAARALPQEPALLRGVEAVRTQLLATLQGHGVTRVASLQQRFDPARHEAATSIPVQDAALDGVVVGVIREGYLAGEDVLRPAMVAVGQFHHEGADR